MASSSLEVTPVNESVLSPRSTFLYEHASASVLRTVSAPSVATVTREGLAASFSDFEASTVAVTVVSVASSASSVQ